MKPYIWACCIVLVAVSFPAACLGPKRTGEDAAKLMEQGESAEAIQILEQLASDGDDRAMLQLGLHYHRGTGIKQDYGMAMDWFLRALSQENADAFVNLGVMHRDGQAVPPNQKIAFCVFLTTHMNGLGTQSTQQRSNSCLRRILAELPKDDIRDCLSNYTLPYVYAYLEARGKMTGIPEQYQPSEESPALRDLGWFMDSELDAIYGEPTEEEKRDREERDRKRRIAYEAMQHTLVFQIRYPKESPHHCRSYEVITSRGMMSGRIDGNALQEQGEHLVCEHRALIHADQHRYVTIARQKNETFVFRIDHPVKAVPCDWQKWQTADFVMRNRMDSIALLNGDAPQTKSTGLPADAPELRFRVD